MFPKEHGAYGQLLFPIGTALAIGRPGIAATALAGAALCAFLAHEPMLVLLGQRGARAGREFRRPAIWWFCGFSALAASMAAASLVFAAPHTRTAVIVPFVLALGLAAFIVTGREHTVAGEVVSASALSFTSYPIGVMSWASSRASLSCAVAFAAVFVMGVVCVHAVIGFTRRPKAPAERLAAAALVVGVSLLIFWLASTRVLELVTPLAVAPAALAGLVLVIRPPSARKLRVVGWTLVATSLATSLVLLAAFR